MKKGPLEIKSTVNVFTRWFKDDHVVIDKLEKVTDTIEEVSAKVKGECAKGYQLLLCKIIPGNLSYRIHPKYLNKQT